jgi:type I restriction enzyme S subunit
VDREWPRLQLAQVLRRSLRPIAVEPAVEYRQLTVRLHHRGVVLRRVCSGALIGSPRQFQARFGQLVLSRIDARNGAIGIVPLDLDGAIVSTDFWLFDINEDLVDPRYVDVYTGTETFVDKCKLASEGTTNRVRLQPDRFLEITMPYPPIDEQRRIVATVVDLASNIRLAQSVSHETRENVSALLTSERASIFEGAARDGTVRLESLAVLERGKFSYRPRNDPRFFGGNHPWIQIGEIENSRKYIREWSETLNDQGLAVSKKFPSGTVLVSIAATIGAVGILEFDCCVPDSIVGLRPKSGTDPEYLYHYLCYVRTHLERVAPQSAQKNINLEILATLPIPALTFESQREVIDRLNALEAAMSTVQQIQAKRDVELDALLPALLDRAFTPPLAADLELRA